MYKIALFGYSFSGKTALFREVTGREDEIYDPSRPNVGVASFKDENLDKVAGAAGAKKRVYPEFEFFDYKGFPESSGFSEEYLRNLLGVDLILCVVDNFREDSHPEKDSGSILMELILYDAARIEKLMGRKTEEGKAPSSQQLHALETGLKLLEEEKMLYAMDEDNKKLLQGMEFLTAKPVVFYINGSKRSILPASTHVIQDVRDFNSGIFYETLIKALSLVTFYTIKGDIAQGWLVPGSFTARESAGRVHRDIEKGFIRAATIHFKDFIEIGDWHKAKSSGILKFLGPNSKISDRDVVEFYFH